MIEVLDEFVRKLAKNKEMIEAHIQSDGATPLPEGFKFIKPACLTAKRNGSKRD